LARLAAGRGLTARDFRDRCTVDGGIRLAFDGPPGWRGQAACSQYDPNAGCRAHAERPLACRLYPLGRERRGRQVRYLHEGRRFPCLDGCPGVRDLPAVSIRDYLAGQHTTDGEQAQDATLELAQDLGEAAFAILIDSGLIRVAGDQAIAAWRQVTALAPDARAQALPERWRDRLLIPDLAPDLSGLDFTAAHAAAMQYAAQSEFATLPDVPSLIQASAWCIAMGLHLVQACGGDPGVIAQQWLDTAERERRSARA
jgi:Fe-S-cluster containining protein